MILHIDMDAFYASIEQRDRPYLRGKPVIVGGLPSKRGVVCSASYEARKFGIKAGMPLKEAKRIFANASVKAHFLPVRMNYYQKISQQIMDILEDYSPLVEAISLDEAYLDLTGTERLLGPPETIALKIKDRINQELNLPVSVGLASNKFLAKLATNLGKPNGFVVLKKEDERKILWDLPVNNILGVGPELEKKLIALGLTTIGAVATAPIEKLIEALGKKIGLKIYELAHGIDTGEVVPYSKPKSCGHFVTFEEDQTDQETINSMLLTLCEKVAFRLREQRLLGKTITFKIRLANFSTFTHSRTLEEPTNCGYRIYRCCLALKQELNNIIKNNPIRSVGVSISNLEPVESEKYKQLLLFDTSKEKLSRLNFAIDSIIKKFGPQAIFRASAAHFYQPHLATIYKDI